MVNTYSKTFEYEDYTSAYLIDVTEAIELFGNRYDEIMKKIKIHPTRSTMPAI